MVLSIIFSVECTLKIIAFGFAFTGPNSYLRNGWNIIDFIIVVFSSITLLARDVDLKVFKVFRLLRILRPLRVVSNNKSLKLLISSLIMSIPSVAQVILITLLFLLILGITGVSYFKGGYYDCFLDATGLEEHSKTILLGGNLRDIILTKWDCLSWGGEWKNAIS